MTDSTSLVRFRTVRFLTEHSLNPDVDTPFSGIFIDSLIPVWWEYGPRDFRPGLGRAAGPPRTNPQATGAADTIHRGATMAAETAPITPLRRAIDEHDREALLLRKGVDQAAGLRRMFQADDAELMRALVAGGLAVIARRRGLGGDAVGRVLFAELRPAIDEGAARTGELAAELPSWIGS